MTLTLHKRVESPMATLEKSASRNMAKGLEKAVTENPVSRDLALHLEAYFDLC